MRIATMNVSRRAMYIQTLEMDEYDSVEQAFAAAARRVLLHHGRYGSAEGFADDDPDRPLPIEVEPRVVHFELKLAADEASSSQSPQRTKSVNALYRASLI